MLAVSEGLSVGKNRSATGSEKWYLASLSQERQMLVALKPRWNNWSFIVKTVDSTW